MNAFNAFKKALLKETDYFVLSTIIDSIRKIGQTKLGISQKALDELDIEKIDSAKIKGLRFIDKKLKKHKG